jgi:hypothetical protein
MALSSDIRCWDPFSSWAIAAATGIAAIGAEPMDVFSRITAAHLSRDFRCFHFVDSKPSHGRRSTAY